MKRLLACLVAWGVASPGASAQTVSFKGKTITMIVGYPAGGGTDISGRLIASVLGKHLPGEPTVTTQNAPGAEGMTALNFFVQQTKADGLTITMGSGSQADPTHYRKPQSHYDPTKFAFIGGVGRGGSALIINAEAEKKLHARDAAPAIMGTTSGAPRTNMQMAAWGKEFLGWNLKWVLGYRGTNELFVALDRSEIDMTATSNLSLFSRLLASGKSKILVQSGTTRAGRLTPRPEFNNAPLMPLLLAGRIKDPIAAKSFDYWLTVHSGPDKWLALPPDTPETVGNVYRDAFSRMTNDPEFIERSKKVADDFTPISYSDVEFWMKALGSTQPEVVEFIAAMMRGQGVKID
jgi:tripartite-type tricarboxylate transporter receptor subunit TctC